jgi:hypothetical protein
MMRLHAAPTLMLMCATGAICCADEAQADVVERRGSEPKLEGRIRQVDDAGVLIVSATGAEHFVTWDRVRSIAREASGPDIQVEQRREAAENLWRARSRLERGDAALAEPLFERLFPEYRGRTHETALIVAEGLLRCRLARGAHDAATIPALEAMRLRRKKVTTIAYSMLPPVIDEATGLCTGLPPYWANTPGLARLESELKSYDAGGDTTIAALASLYRAALRQQLGLPEESRADIAADQPGVALMKLLVDAGSPETAVRDAARATLEKRLPELPIWAQAWARFAIGTSLLAESGTGQHHSGLVNLAWLPASFQKEQPYLTALALAVMTQAFSQMGEAEASATLQSELQRLYPAQPDLNAPVKWLHLNDAANDASAH